MLALASFTGHTLPIIANWSQALGITTLVAGAAHVYLQHVCHIHRCWRPAWHPHPQDGHPRCRKHHPDDPRTLA